MKNKVLKEGGLVNAETPLQQVHEGRYDFTRFTYLWLLMPSAVVPQLVTAWT